MFLAALGAQSASAADHVRGSQDAWQFDASVYVYLPTVDTTSAFPADSNGSTINISGEQIFDNLEFFFMGSMEARKERWGVFTDVVYLDIATNKTQSRDFTFGDSGLPTDTNADLSYSLQGLAWTIAGEYRVAHSALTLDTLAGVRLFDLEQSLAWNIAGNLGPINAGRSDVANLSFVLWDAVVGIKGRYALGRDRSWSIPFYLDVGTGDAELTWQAATGLNYAFSWGEVKAVWRYLDYELPPGGSTAGFNFSGPQVGVSFVW